VKSLSRLWQGILRRTAGERRGNEKAYRYHYQKIDDVFLRQGMKNQADNWRDVVLVADLRPTDLVLDMGCAEGLVSMEVAGRVAHVDGVEVEPDRVNEARRLANNRKIQNISFAAGSIVDYPIISSRYDVVLLLSVLGKETETGHVGLRELERMLVAARRQIVVRLGVQKYSTLARSISLPQILAKMDACGFDGICFARRDGFGNLIVGNRRGTDARLGIAPPFVLIPTEYLGDHPCLRDAEIGSLRDFP
jgi:2-polyprenyl-3-methyl-5-hydroxy-6-metoxy-1,4-benzoquinol methylase